MISTNANVESWKSNVPESWSIIPLKFITSYNDEKLSELSDPDLIFDYIDIGSVSYENGIETVQRCCFKDAPSRARRVVRENDVILSTVRTYLKAGAIIPEHDRLMIVSTGFITIRAKETILSQYLKYLILSHGFVSEVECRSYGSNYPAINPVEIENITVPLPDIKSQESITSFLDARCSSIDSAISKHQQIIEKLEEYRKAVITQAVTKGLNLNVEMKDSGNMIIGTIPSSWQCPPLKMLLSDNENNMRVGPFGSSLPSRIFQDDGPWVYNQRCVLDNNFEATDVHIPEWKFEEMKSFAVYPGDMLITTRGTIGKVAIVPHDAKKGILHPCLIRFRLDNAKILNEYVQYVFNGTDIVMNQIKQASGSTTIEALYSGPLRSIKLPNPSVEEQHYIVSWLNIKCKKIAKTIEAHNQLISKLQEYKQSLIYNAVTGKIDCTTEASI